MSYGDALATAVTEAEQHHDLPRLVAVRCAHDDPFGDPEIAAVYAINRKALYVAVRYDPDRTRAWSDLARLARASGGKAPEWTSARGTVHYDLISWPGRRNPLPAWCPDCGVHEADRRGVTAAAAKAAQAGQEETFLLRRVRRPAR